MNTVTGGPMKPWMPILASSLLLLFTHSVFARCEFKKDVEKVNSLSGPVSVLLNEIGLLKNSKVMGISSFHPFDSSDFQGNILPGGVFLSRSLSTQFNNSVVFYDDARELNQLLKSFEGVKLRKIVTRNLLPLEAVEVTIKSMQDYLSGCEKQLNDVLNKAKKVQDQLLAKFSNRPRLIFYLGEIRNGKRPELVIVNDGVIKLLIKENKIITYPSELAYVNWSSKIINGLPADTLHIGIKDSGAEKVKKIKRSSQEMTLIYPGSLVPGLTQLEAFLYLAQNL